MSKMKNIMTSMSHGTGFLLFHKKTEKGNRFSFIQGPDGQEIKMKSCFDTDKDFQMSSDEVTFNADSVRSKLELLSEELMHRCGLVYELYQRRLSAAIDNFVSTLPTEQHLLVLELAREEFDYLSAEEIAEEIRRDAERGYCCHGFDRNCCPLGCGDLDDDCCNAADLMEEP